MGDCSIEGDLGGDVGEIQKSKREEEGMLDCLGGETKKEEVQKEQMADFSRRQSHLSLLPESFAGGGEGRYESSVIKAGIGRKEPPKKHYWHHYHYHYQTPGQTLGFGLLPGDCKHLYSFTGSSFSLQVTH